MKLKFFFTLLGILLMSSQTSNAQFYFSLDTPCGVITFGPNGPDASNCNFFNFDFSFDASQTVPIVTAPVTYYPAYPTTVDSGYSSSSDYSSSSSTQPKTCRAMSGSDIAHCNGSGVCQKCNGKGSYYDTSFGNSQWKNCFNCNGSGKCPSCHGTGVRY